MPASIQNSVQCFLPRPLFYFTYIINYVTILYVSFLEINMAERKAVIKNADMSEEMQQDAIDCATQALEKYNIEKVFFR